MIKKITLILMVTAAFIIAQTPDMPPANESQVPPQQEPMPVDPQPAEPAPLPSVEAAPVVSPADSVSTSSDGEKAETEKPGSKSKVVITPKRENQTEVIKTYSGEVNILKSPKKAFFLSLLIPGLGEYYAGANVPRVAIPAGLEVATWVTSAIFRMKYNEKTDIYKKYADEHYDHNKFSAWFQYVNDSNTANVVIRRTAHDSSYFKNDQPGKTNDYYEMIGKYDIFTQGWDDAHPHLDATYYNNQNGSFFARLVDTQKYWSAFALDSSKGYYKEDNSATPSIVKPLFVHTERGEESPFYYGLSAHQLAYMALRDDANEMADLSRGVLFTLIVNRLVSAVDAALAATSYNTKVTGGSLSRLQRIHLEPIQVGTTVVPANGVAATYKF